MLREGRSSRELHTYELSDSLFPSKISHCEDWLEGKCGNEFCKQALI